jgi:hypothetical protein|tara:strand:+ start:4334 stop:5296 length:963 start_codon:yes stop_codon:yes gene_type:complete
MLFYKFIFIKIIQSIILGALILLSVLYIFSIIELLSQNYELTDTLVIGLINTIELLMTIPSILLLMSIILFWNNLKKTNELIIIRHYLSLKKIMLIYSLFILIFASLEINKNNLNSNIKYLKEIYLKGFTETEINQKVFFNFNNQELTISKFNGLNIKKRIIAEISIYKFKNDIFEKSIYSNENQIIGNKIVMKNPNIVTSQSIKDIKGQYVVNLEEFEDGLYNNLGKLNLSNKKELVNPIGLLKKITLMIVLFAYISVFISREAINKNASALKYISISVLIFIYSFVTSQIYLESYHIVFHLSVLLTLTFYLYKNLINE